MLSSTRIIQIKLSILNHERGSYKLLYTLCSLEIPELENKYGKEVIYIKLGLKGG